MDNKARKHILTEIFNNRFDTVRTNLIISFMMPPKEEDGELGMIKERIIETTLAQDIPFEAMTEAMIFYGEGVAMKAFTEYIQMVAKEWNEQNKDGRHFSVDLKVTLQDPEKLKV